MTYQLHVDRRGHGSPALLLIHGLGASGRYWGQVAETVQAEFQVLAPDLLGFGRSPWPRIGYTIDDHLDALDAILQAEGLEHESLLLAGHSLGTILSLAWAARHPRRFRGLVLIGLPCYRSSEEARRHVAGLGPLAYATVARPKLGARICALMCFGRPFWRLVAPALMPHVPAEVARDGVLHTWESYSGTLRHGILDLDIPALAGRVAATGLATRLLHADLDREAPLHGVAELARSTGWPLDLVRGASHGLPIERPRACARAIHELKASAFGGRQYDANSGIAGQPSRRI